MRLPKHPCAYPGCRALVSSGNYCNTHRRPRQQAREAGYDSRWDVYASAYLRHHPICADPFYRHLGVLVPATVCGHRIPHRGDTHLLWDPANHYALCAGCNAYQCAKFEGGFGNPKRQQDLLRLAREPRLAVAASGRKKQ